MKNKETMIFLSAARLEEQAAARITAERPVSFGRYPRARACGGGFPIKVNGKFVGAIKVSGAPAVQNDVDCVMAALALVLNAVPAD